MIELGKRYSSSHKNKKTLLNRRFQRGGAKIPRPQRRSGKGGSGFKKFTKKRIKDFSKSPRVAAPILAYLILLGPTLYLYSATPPEEEVQVYKGFWCPFIISAHALAEMKDMGVNTVFIGWGVTEEHAASLIQTAHKNGIKVAVCVGFDEPYPKSWEIDVEAFNFQVIEAAKFAERLGVEFFSPLNELDDIFRENGARWGQEILPRIREVYHGKLIWKGCIFSPIAKSMGDIDYVENTFFPPGCFSGYDYIGFSITPFLPDRPLEKYYPQFVDNILDNVLAWAERDNCKGVMVTEFGAWGLLEMYGGPGCSEEEAARAHEIVLERGKGKINGFFALNIPGGAVWGMEISGKTEEVFRKWYREIL